MEERIKECPYCFSNRVSLHNEEHGEYYCESCECWFTETDVEIEDIRHEIYHFLAENHEKNPMLCDIATDTEHSVASCFSCDDGTLWFTMRGETEPKDFDDFVVEELRNILIGLQETL